VAAGGTTGRYAAGAVEREFISLLGGAAATWPINFKPSQFRRRVGKSVDFSLFPSNLEHYVTAVFEFLDNYKGTRTGRQRLFPAAGPCWRASRCSALSPIGTP
jgi:hypothetical protein